MSMHDVLMDIKGEYVDYTLKYKGNDISGQVHSGILTAAQNIVALVKDLMVGLLETHHDYRPIILGHSLGAGTASMIALMWMEDEFIMSRGLRAYCYSVPSTMSSEFHQAAGDVIISVIFGNDLVPKVSIGVLRDFAQMMLYFENRDRGRANIKAANIVKCLIYGYKGKEKALIKIYKEIKAQSTSYKLEPPGHVYQIFDKSQHKEFNFIHTESEVKLLGFFIPNDYHREMVFTRTMMTDHTQIQLMKAMQKIITGHAVHIKTGMMRQAAATIIRSTLVLRGETDDNKINREIQDALDAIQESSSEDEDNASVAPSMFDRRSTMRNTSIFSEDYRDELSSAIDDLEYNNTVPRENSKYEEEKV